MRPDKIKAVFGGLKDKSAPWPLLFVLGCRLPAEDTHAANGVATKSDAQQATQQVRSSVIKIDCNGGSGSGFVVAKAGSQVTAITNEHVVHSCRGSQVNIYAPPAWPQSRGVKVSLKKSNNFGQSTQQNGLSLCESKMEIEPEIDLATLAFELPSGVSLSVAPFATTRLPKGAGVTMFGYPQKSSALEKHEGTDAFYLSTCKADGRPIHGGYNLLSSALGLPGMSGGPVTNESGMVVGVAGHIDGNSEVQCLDNGAELEATDSCLPQSSWSAAIPVEQVLKFLQQRGVKPNATGDTECLVGAEGCAGGQTSDIFW